MAVLERLSAEDLAEHYRDLAGTGPWATFREWLRERYLEGLLQLVNCNETGDLRESRGYLQAMTDILRFPDDVKERMREMKVQMEEAYERERSAG